MVLPGYRTECNLAIVVIGKGENSRHLMYDLVSPDPETSVSGWVEITKPPPSIFELQGKDFWVLMDFSGYQLFQGNQS